MTVPNDIAALSAFPKVAPDQAKTLGCRLALPGAIRASQLLARLKWPSCAARRTPPDNQSPFNHIAGRS
jgi:hypothetical protein